MAYDKLHTTIRMTLEANGFQCLKDPLHIRHSSGLKFFIDLEMERNSQLFAIEIKTFNSSFLAEFYKLLGQVLIYRRVLILLEKPHEVYTAITQETYQKYFQDDIPDLILKRYHLNIMAIDTHHKTVSIHRY